MQVVLANNKKLKKEYKNFRKKLYKGDPYYVSTIEFTFDMLFYKQTLFTKSIDIIPVMIKEKEVLVTALLIHNPKDDFLQISFFEALEDQHLAVEMLVEYAKEVARRKDLKRIIIGLNGHLSYGVGLSVDMVKPNTFDSTYSKLYYNKYFEQYKKHELVSFINNPNDVFPLLKTKESKVKIRPINFKKFKEEMEIFRNICDETIGTTFLYTKTDKNHFYDLIDSMRFFLKPENILFVEDKDEVVGFIFWHPDYNEILKPGKPNCLLTIVLRYILFKNRIKKVKLNSIGIKEKYQGVVTINLLKEVGKMVQKYEQIETNFVWKNNNKSMAINKKLLQNIERRFAIYEVLI